MGLRAAQCRPARGPASGGSPARHPLSPSWVSPAPSHVHPCRQGSQILGEQVTWEGHVGDLSSSTSPWVEPCGGRTPPDGCSGGRWPGRRGWRACWVALSPLEPRPHALLLSAGEHGHRDPRVQQARVQRWHHGQEAEGAGRVGLAPGASPALSQRPRAHPLPPGPRAGGPRRLRGLCKAHGQPLPCPVPQFLRLVLRNSEAPCFWRPYPRGDHRDGGRVHLAPRFPTLGLGDPERGYNLPILMVASVTGGGDR